MGQIRDIQNEIHDWQKANFPFDQDKPYRKLIGIGEEVGELNHAYLRYELGKNVTPQIKDAIGDIFIFLASFSKLLQFDLEDAILETLKKVKERENPADRD